MPFNTASQALSTFPVVRFPVLAICGIAGGLLCGCEPGETALTARPPQFAPTNQARCSVAASKARPLIVEWPSADRAALEARARRGLVVVRYSGCEIEVLPRCSAGGHYRYAGTEYKRDIVSMKDADELYTNLPLGAAKLEARLQKSGSLNVAMTIVGQFEADTDSVARSDLEGQCKGATHVVSGLTAGAFEFYAGGAASVGGEVDVMGAGAGGKTESKRELLSQDGNLEACKSSNRKDPEPPQGCGAALRIEVMPIQGAGAPAPTAPVVHVAPAQQGPAPQCKSDDDCATGQRCRESRCMEQPGTAPLHETPDQPKNLVGLLLSYDFSFVKSTTNVCGRASQAGGSFSCFRENGQQYHGEPTTKDSNAVKGGLAPSTFRVMAAYDRVIAGPFALGVRLGYAFGGRPKPDSGRAFMPAHLELRATLGFGKHPFSNTALDPFIFFGGGVAEVNWKYETGVKESKTCPSTGCEYTGSDGTTGVNPQTQVLTAWHAAGLGFVAAGAGLRFYGVVAAVKIMQLFPTSGTTLSPELGYMYAF